MLETTRYFPPLYNYNPNTTTSHAAVFFFLHKMQKSYHAKKKNNKIKDMTGHYFAPRVNNYSLARNKFQNRRIKHYKSRFHNYTLFTSISVPIIKMLLILQKTLRKYISEVRLEPSRTPSIKLFAKIVNGF